MQALPDIVRAFLLHRNELEMKDFILGLFTPKELGEIARRLEIVRLLEQGKPQHEIAAKVSVGVATVTRGAKEIQKNHFKRWRAHTASKAS
jgi:TrpR family transcriptional regulator, trp operon repressor